jgi:hypothetical protein
MATYDRVKDLPLQVESYELEGLEQRISPEFTRKTTVVRLRGAGQEGIGEDVTYDPGDQEALQRDGGSLPITRSHTFDSFSKLLEHLSLFPAGPALEQFREYRRWAFESAALDLALRQAGTTLAAALEREPRPVRYVVSLRLGDPPSLEPIRNILEVYPETRFKLDPTGSWTEQVVAQLVAANAVDTVDFKGAYKGTPVDQAPDPLLYGRVAIAFPQAWLEDPAITEETRPVLEPHSERVTWDAPIHSVADIGGLEWAPRTLNFKPSRFGSVQALLDAYDYCAEEGIGIYGGGQFELGPGRGQIQYLASLFHADSPNDVAPGAFNAPNPPPGLSPSPLEPRPSATGFRWDSDESF